MPTLLHDDNSDARIEAVFDGAVGAVEAASEGVAGRGPAATFFRNSLISVGRLLVTTAIALALPAFLAHRLPVKTYSAWVLILQMSAYVGYLDFGIQTGIAKYVAEFEARKDLAGASLRASAGFALMVCTSSLGIMLTLGLAWRVPQLFHEMPREFYHDARISLIFVGVSLSVGLLSSVFSAIFLGLQNYVVPMVLSLANRVLYTVVILTTVYRHGSLATMGAAVAAVNVLTALLQYAAWRRLAGSIRVSLRGLDYSVIRSMLAYCSSLAIWSAGMLCVTGLDITIVGRYDFNNTAFYSVATLPTNFMISIMGAALAPLLPTASSLSVHSSGRAMGETLGRATRYSSILLILCGLPLVVCGYWILWIWVGPVYARQSLPYLRILVLANVVRQLCLPYSSMLVATGRQRVAIAGASAEGIVNVVSSVMLIRRFGAIGVAYGTLIGSFVSVGMHFAISMRFTYDQISITRVRLLVGGMLRPALIVLPALALERFWWVAAGPALGAEAWAALAAATLLVAWFAGLDAGERKRLQVQVSRRFGRAAGYN